MRPTLVFALVAFSSAAPAVAAPPATIGVPEKGEGTIALFGGSRFIPGNGNYLNDQGGKHQLFQPGALAAFGYQFDDDLHFTIDLGYGVDSYQLNTGGDLLVRSFQVLLGVDTALKRGSWYTVYGGGGIGYSLNTGTRNGVNNEANSTAVYLALGWRIRLAEKLALVLEDRYTLANAAVDPTSTRTLNVGGNLFMVGFLFHFLEPDEKGMAPHSGN
jgi:opacity protein-like surface antigen